MVISLGLPDVDPPVPSPMLGHIVIVLLGAPVQFAVKVPVVEGAPPTLALMLPKLMSVNVKLQDWALAEIELTKIEIHKKTKNLKGIEVAQSMFGSALQP